jgi:hypothetical protein
VGRQVDVIFIVNPQGYHRAFKSLDGMLGRHIAKLTEKTRATAVLEAPHPGGPPHGRTGINYSTGELVSKIKSNMGHWHGPGGSEIEGTVRSGAPHTQFVIGGTRPHVIKPRTPGGMLAFHWARAGGKKVAFPHVRHPGSPANDFLNKALVMSII